MQIMKKVKVELTVVFDKPDWMDTDDIDGWVGEAVDIALLNGLENDEIGIDFIVTTVEEI